ncbi:MAG TPA: aquaporin Z [Methanomicrobiales archaeon]|nr:aquaporin Z [Methanomicrobiales archaeon]
MKKMLAELLGTAALVFIGCGSAVISGRAVIGGTPVGVGILGIALAFGLVLLAMVYAIGPLTGCHINPAVSIGMLVAGRIGGRDAAGYIVAQCIGAIIGAGLLLGVAGGLPSYSLAVNGLGQNGYGIASPAGYNLPSCALAEVILTALFAFVVLRATSKEAPAGFAGLAIGLALAMVHIVGIPITGTSVNPARSLGPAVFVGGTALAQLWLFIVAPVIGGILAALAWKYLGSAQA